MAVVRQLVEYATYPIAMGVGVGLCLWALLGPLRIDRLTVSERAISAKADHLPLVPVDRPTRPPGRVTSAIADFPLVAGDRGPLVTQMQGALIAKGYGVGLAGADGDFNDDTLTALAAFQDNDALPVQQTCDQECWTTLGLSLPE